MVGCRLRSSRVSEERAPVMFLLVVFLSAFVVGCGESQPERYKVTGKVSYKGEPVELGSVVFSPTDGQATSASGDIQPDGTFTLVSASRKSAQKLYEGVAAGEYHVAIIASKVVGGREKTWDDFSPSEQETMKKFGETPFGSIGNPHTVWLVPNKYASDTTSGLKVVVEAKENVVDFDLP